MKSNWSSQVCESQRGKDCERITRYRSGECRNGRRKKWKGSAGSGDEKF